MKPPHLQRVLPVAIGLLLLRATMRSGIEKLTLTLASSPLHVVDTHPYLAAHLIGLEDFCRQLPELRKKRQLVQNRRRRSDAELFELFGDPLRLHETGGLYEDVARALIREFGIDEMVGATRQSRAARGGNGSSGTGRASVSRRRATRRAYRLSS